MCIGVHDAHAMLRNLIIRKNALIFNAGFGHYGPFLGQKKPYGYLIVCDIFGTASYSKAGRLLTILFCDMKFVAHRENSG